MKDLLPIGVLLAIVTLVIVRLPKIDLGHSDEYRFRRFLNWFPLGLCYAFLYMGRYNLTVSKDVKFLTESAFGTVFMVGAWVYGVAFIINGPLTDKYGGRRAILLAAAGAAVANAAMGVVARYGLLKEHATLVFSVLYGVNMYFQSFGAVAVVKVNSAWFHVRERGTFGGIFGILISLGLFFAYDWGAAILRKWGIDNLFFVPSGILFVFFCLCYLLVRDHPSEAGHADIEVGDASSGDTGPPLPIAEVAKKILLNPVMMIITAIEFCSGFLRNAIMHWYKDYAKGIATALDIVDKDGKVDPGFVSANWGMLLCVAGIMGGVFAGTISDRIFQSRRAPVSAVLYGIMIVGAIAMMPVMGQHVVVGWLVVVMSMAVIGVHGMLSGTASADFGGKKNAGVAVGIVDGFVYLGAGLQSVVLGNLLPEKGTTAAKNVSNWTIWPVVILPLSVVGFVLATRIWNAKPKPKEAPKDMPKTDKPAPVAASSTRGRGSRATQPKILEQVLASATTQGEKGVVIFDLDSTLLDNRPRQAKIVAEWGEKKGLALVAACGPQHLDGWDLRVALLNVGLSREDADRHYPELKDYWKGKFFTSEYCKLDAPTPGAPGFVQKLLEKKVKIAYCTGRHEEMRAGTAENLVQHGFPKPGENNVALIMKPRLEESDDDFKKVAYAQLRALGVVVSAFDNEPTHVNGYKEAFPEALVIHLDTDNSGRPVEVLGSIPSVLDFQL